MTEEYVRLNWYEALDNAECGEALSGVIQWGFSAQDLFVLYCIHQMGDLQKKIEDLLDDCNFHTLCSYLSDKKYDEARKWIEKEMIDENTPFS